MVCDLLSKQLVTVLSFHTNCEFMLILFLGASVPLRSELCPDVLVKL
jgi:hypothetical protein